VSAKDELGARPKNQGPSHRVRRLSNSEILSSRKTVAPKNRSRTMLQDRLATHPRPWALGPRCQLQGCSQIQSTNRELHRILVYYESHRTFCIGFVQEKCYIGPPYENVTQKRWSPDCKTEYPCGWGNARTTTSYCTRLSL